MKRRLHLLSILFLIFGIEIISADDSSMIRKQVEHYLQNVDDFENSAEFDAVNEIMVALNLSGRCTVSDFVLVGSIYIHFLC